MKSFTKKYMRDNCGCYSREKLAACSFMKKRGDISLQVIMESEIPLKDCFWFLCNKVLSIAENQSLAIECAEAVLPIWEAEYPDDMRPRKAINAAKECLVGSIGYTDITDATYAVGRAADAAAFDAAVDAASAADAAAYAVRTASAVTVLAAYAPTRSAAAASTAYTAALDDRAALAALESILKKYAKKYY